MMYLFNAFYFVSNLLMRLGFALEHTAWLMVIRFSGLEALAKFLKRTDVPANLQDSLWSAYVRRVTHIGHFMRLLHPEEWGGGYPEWVRELAADQIEEICLQRNPSRAWFGGDNPYHPTRGRAAYLVALCDLTGLGGLLRLEMLKEMDIFYPAERKVMFPA